jgi:hypothetical protein
VTSVAIKIGDPPGRDEQGSGARIQSRGLGYRRLAFDKALVCWYSCANAYVR